MSTGLSAHWRPGSQPSSKSGYSLYGIWRFSLQPLPRKKEPDLSGSFFRTLADSWKRWNRKSDSRRLRVQDIPCRRSAQISAIGSRHPMDEHPAGDTAANGRAEECKWNVLNEHKGGVPLSVPSLSNPIHEKKGTGSFRFLFLYHQLMTPFGHFFAQRLQFLHLV